MIALFLLACVGEKPADSDASGDSAEDTAEETDSGGAWEAPDPGCELLDPLPVFADAVPPLHELGGPNLLVFVAFTADFPSYGAVYGCPTPTPGGAEGSTLWSGACDFEGFAWQGGWVATERSDERGEVVSEAGSALRFRDDSYGYTVAFDGMVHYEETADGGTIERDFRLALDGYADGLDGTWTIDSAQDWAGDGWYLEDAHIDVEQEGGLDGEYCLVYESYPHATCAEERRGGWVLQGDATLVVRYDPDTACDGCGEVTIDGVPVGEMCGDEYRPYAR